MIIIPLSLTRPPITTNRQPRNYGHKAALVRKIQDDAGWHAKELMARRDPENYPLDMPVSVRLVWTVPDKRVRDASAPDPTLKAAQDALVSVGFLLRDDHTIVARSYCVIEKGDKYAMRLEIEAT